MYDVKYKKFDAAIESYVDDVLKKQLKQFENTVVCAGLNSSMPSHEKARIDVVNRARVNHYGAGGRPPSRQFVYAAIGDIEDEETQYADEIKQAIIRFLKGATSTLYRQPQVNPLSGALDAGVPRSQLVKGHDLETFFDHLGDTMASNMQNAIEMKHFRGPKDNTEATEERKGDNDALIETREMVDSITYWLSTQDAEEIPGESLTSDHPLNEEE